MRLVHQKSAPCMHQRVAERAEASAAAAAGRNPVHAPKECSACRAHGGAACCSPLMHYAYLLYHFFILNLVASTGGLHHAHAGRQAPERRALGARGCRRARCACILASAWLAARSLSGCRLADNVAKQGCRQEERKAVTHAELGALVQAYVPATHPAPTRALRTRRQRRGRTSAHVQPQPPSPACSAAPRWRARAGKFEDATALMGLVAHAETDAWLALSLASYLNLLPLSRQLSCLSGSLWSRTLQARGPAAPGRLPLL